MFSFYLSFFDETIKIIVIPVKEMLDVSAGVKYLRTTIWDYKF